MDNQIIDENLAEEMNICIPVNNVKQKTKTKRKTKNNSNVILTHIDNGIQCDDNVLTLCPIPESINIDNIKEQISAYMLPRTSYYKEKKRSPYIEDEFSEHFTAKACEGTEIGGGHCGMDVKTKHNEGIDAMCVIMNKDISNEKSLIQNFKSSGSNLDTLFKEQKDSEAVVLFMNDYLKKMLAVKKEKNLNELYILAYISTNKDVYLACFKLNISKIDSVTSGGFVNNGSKKINHVNIIVENFIDSKIGKVTLYKSKKRVELRLKKELLQEEHVCKIYSML
jgi:hypothetical protein